MKHIKPRLNLVLATAMFALTNTAYVKETNDFASFSDFNSNIVRADFDPEKLVALEKRMHKFVADGETMGIATLLVRNGKVASYAQAGVRDIVKGKPISQDTIYRIYSMSKPIIGVAMMMLYEQGEFSLSDPVSKFIPEFESLEVVKSYEKDGSFELEPLERQATMQELMSHTGGFAYGFSGMDPSNVEYRKQDVLGSSDLQSLVNKVASAPLMHQPGTKWEYSISVDLQGAIIERITGMTLSEYLDKKLFTPLGMTDTAFYVSTGKADRLADLFAYHPITQTLQRMPFSEPDYNLLGDISYSKETRGMESGGGGLVSTMADYARFCQMLINGGTLNGIRVITEESVKLMSTNILSAGQKVDIDGDLSSAQTDRLGFGLNFGVIMGAESNKSKYGDGSYYWGGAAGTWFWIDPVNDLFFIGMIQRFPKGPQSENPDFRGVSQEFVYDALVH
jgi:CubicO group peptidase (beta-lactamase class C family)